MRLTAGREERGKRVDMWLAVAAGISRSRAVAALAGGAVTLNGKTVQPASRVREGDVLDGELPAGGEHAVLGEAGAVPVVFQDRDIAVVDKPAGLTVHPGAGRPGGTLVNVLLGMGVELAPAGGKVRPGVVHRLDRNTSGLMVLAKTDRAYWALVKMVQKRRIHREYLAVVAGAPTPPAGTIEGALERDRQHREKFSVVSEGGRAATTHYRVEKRYAGAALVRIVLGTGRTHQIRVHFAAMGWPLAGDGVYGNRMPKGTPAEVRGFGRQALHSVKLSFAHPVTGKELAFESPLPPDISSLLDSLR